MHAELKQANDARCAAEERAEEAVRTLQKATSSHQAEVHTLRAELQGAQEALQTVLERYVGVYRTHVHFSLLNPRIWRYCCLTNCAASLCMLLHPPYADALVDPT